MALWQIIWQMPFLVVITLQRFCSIICHSFSSATQPVHTFIHHLLRLCCDVPRYDLSNISKQAFIAVKLVRPEVTKLSVFDKGNLS